MDQYPYGLLIHIIMIGLLGISPTIGSRKKRSVIVVNHHCPVDEVHVLFLYMKLEWLHDMTAVGKAVLSSTTAMSIMKLSNSTIPASFSFCWNITIYDIRNNRTGDPKLPYPEDSDYLTLPNMLFLI